MWWQRVWGQPSCRLRHSSTISLIYSAVTGLRRSSLWNFFKVHTNERCATSLQFHAQACFLLHIDASICFSIRWKQSVKQYTPCLLAQTLLSHFPSENSQLSVRCHRSTLPGKKVNYVFLIMSLWVDQTQIVYNRSDTALINIHICRVLLIHNFASNCHPIIRMEGVVQCRWRHAPKSI